MHTYTPANSIFDGPITSLLSVLCILVEVLSRGHAKRGKSLNDFKFSTSISRFSSDGAVSTVVKGLMYRNLRMENFRKNKNKQTSSQKICGHSDQGALSSGVPL